MTAKVKKRDAKVTIHTVAKQANVSIATVSRVLSGSSTVRKDLADRVIAAAEELSYVPSASAQNLAIGKTLTLGVIVPDLSNPYFPRVIKGIEKKAKESDYTTIIADSEGDAAAELSMVNRLSSKVDGLILISPRMDKVDFKNLENSKVPIVVLNRIDSGVGITNVSVDNFSAMSELCGLLLTLGHKKVSFLNGPEGSWQREERKRAISNSEKYGLESVTIEAGGTIQSGYENFELAMESKPTAIICFNDLVAYGVITRAKELGIRIPQDLSVTGFDDIEFAQYSSPSLTTIQSPQGPLGIIGWETLFEKMQTGNSVTAPTIKATMIVRESTGPAKNQE
jgi:LacI family transcriptional regulator, repressor for deo operon, udp, cdd, tsx, nupC, and nupG